MVAASGGVSRIEVDTHSVPYICTISFEVMARLSGNSQLCWGELGSLEVGGVFQAEGLVKG